MTGPAPDLEETPARQGTTGTGLRWVLRISLALIVVVFLAIWLAFAHRGGEESPANADRVVSTTPNTVKEAAATAPPGSVTAQTAGRKEQTTGG